MASFWDIYMGWAYAYFANKYPELEKDSPIPYAFMSLLGPINFIGFLFGVCVYDKKWYGWRLW